MRGGLGVAIVSASVMTWLLLGYSETPQKVWGSGVLQNATLGWGRDEFFGRVPNLAEALRGCRPKEVCRISASRCSH